jgi:hypothetical protein
MFLELQKELATQLALLFRLTFQRGFKEDVDFSISGLSTISICAQSFHPSRLSRWRINFAILKLGNGTDSDFSNRLQLIARCDQHFLTTNLSSGTSQMSTIDHVSFLNQSCECPNCRIRQSSDQTERPFDS